MYADQIFQLAFLTFGWTLNPFIKKLAIGDLNSDQYLFCNSIVSACFISVIFFSKSGELEFMNSINFAQLIWILLGNLVTYGTSYLLVILVKKQHISYLIPQLQPVVIILTVFIGHVVFHEHIFKTQILGILAIIFGLLLINFVPVR